MAGIADICGTEYNRDRLALETRLSLLIPQQDIA